MSSATFKCLLCTNYVYWLADNASNLNIFSATTSMLLENPGSITLRGDCMSTVKFPPVVCYHEGHPDCKFNFVHFYNQSLPKPLPLLFLAKKSTTLMGKSFALKHKYNNIDFLQGDAKSIVMTFVIVMSLNQYCCGNDCTVERFTHTYIHTGPSTKIKWLGNEKSVQF